ncbi:hypothetical protein GCM10022403_000360 [Streptomyces coacervatus]|uniref:CHAT domain-containing protein n=1 Tax=Streptomyces coacervatus TaxID=647381 RepID=A0ABP7GLS1_9ACTN|nr:SCO5717 family growth-regulating ATPase [Streptomyces coacervatus]MDF2265088.1 SCO5717 family growth-regulating ATPase [Streptomyces coacervatus]
MDAELERLAVWAARILLQAPTEGDRARILSLLESIPGGGPLASQLRLYEPYEHELVADLLRLLERDMSFAAALRLLVIESGPPPDASATDLTGDFTINYAPPAWYTLSAEPTTPPVPLDEDEEERDGGNGDLESGATTRFSSPWARESAEGSALAEPAAPAPRPIPQSGLPPLPPSFPQAPDPAAGPAQPQPVSPAPEQPYAAQAPQPPVPPQQNQQPPAGYGYPWPGSDSAPEPAAPPPPQQGGYGFPPSPPNAPTWPQPAQGDLHDQQQADPYAGPLGYTAAVELSPDRLLRTTKPKSARWRPEAPAAGPGVGPDAEGGSTEPRRLVAELAEQTSPGREVPLHVQIVRGGGRGVQLASFFVPRKGAHVLITIHAPGLVAVDELQQELHVKPGRDSDVLLFRLRAAAPGLHQVTVRAFRGGTFLGEVRCQMSVEPGGITRDGPRRQASLPSMAFDPGEVTLQVLKDEAAGTYSFQLISERFYAPEIFRFRGGDPRLATEQLYAELRRAAKDATRGGDADAERLRGRLRNHGVQLWTAAVPQAVQSQFWHEVDQVTAFTVLGEHDIVPWELLYPLNEGRQDRGFLAEWLPVVRRVFGQDRVRSIGLPGAAFVVPPGSPADAGEEVTSLRARLGATVADAGVLTERVALTALIEGGHAGLLHFACHNAFTGSGSCVTMADGPFDPIDLASAAQLRTLRPHRPLVFFNACRSAGEIDWFGESLGWAPQFLNAGAGAFVGTLWPVRSRSALQFAEAFYDRLITHRQPLGQASLAARQTVRDLHGGDPTWLAYAVYGSPAATAHTTAYEGVSA